MTGRSGELPIFHIFFPVIEFCYFLLLLFLVDDFFALCEEVETCSVDECLLLDVVCAETKLVIPRKIIVEKIFFHS